MSDQWATLDAIGNIESQPRGNVSPCDPPRIHIPECISSCHRNRQKLGELGSGVVCFLVVEGLQGARSQKLVVRSSVEQIAELAFFEAANGYNVVFGGLLLKKQLAILGRENTRVSFVRVKNLGELVEKDGEAGGETGALEVVWVCY